MKISVHADKEHILHGGVICDLSRLDIRYTHKKEGRKIIWAADSYLVVRLNDGIPAKRY